MYRSRQGNRQPKAPTPDPDSISSDLKSDSFFPSADAPDSQRPYIQISDPMRAAIIIKNRPSRPQSIICSVPPRFSVCLEKNSQAYLLQRISGPGDLWSGASWFQVLVEQVLAPLGQGLFARLMLPPFLDNRVQGTFFLLNFGCRVPISRLKRFIVLPILR